MAAFPGGWRRWGFPGCFSRKLPPGASAGGFPGCFSRMLPPVIYPVRFPRRLSPVGFLGGFPRWAPRRIPPADFPGGFPGGFPHDAFIGGLSMIPWSSFSAASFPGWLSRRAVQCVFLPQIPSCNLKGCFVFRIPIPPSAFGGFVVVVFCERGTLIPTTWKLAHVHGMQSSFCTGDVVGPPPRGFARPNSPVRCICDDSFDCIRYRDPKREFLLVATLLQRHRALGYRKTSAAL